MYKLQGLKVYSGQVCDMADAGDLRNLFRHAEADGLRLSAYIARFVEPGQDPVQVLHGLLLDAGCDVGAWDESEEGE